MFANLKKKIEVGGAVSPVGVSSERKAGGVNNSTTKTQSTSYVHGAGLPFLSFFVHAITGTQCISWWKYKYFAAGS